MGGPAGEEREPRIPPWYLALAATLLAIIAALLLVLVLRDDGAEDVEVGDSTTSTELTETTDSTPETTAEETTSTISTTTTEATTTEAPSSSTAPPSTVDVSAYDSAVWPWPASALRYDDPVAAALGFSTELVGFDDPIVGEFMAGDSRSGEVEVRPRPDGPVTLVLVRQLGPDNTWWVLGAVTENIVVDEPEALASISSPLTVTGSAWAFEGTVDVDLRVRGREDAVASGFVTGGGTEMLPFEDTFDWTSIESGPGALVLFTRSAEDGSVWEATVTAITFA